MIVCGRRQVWYGQGKDPVVISTALVIGSLSSLHSRPNHRLDFASPPTTTRANTTSDKVPNGDEYACDTCQLALRCGVAKVDLPLKMAMKKEAMAEMTELIAEAMAEIMLPMLVVCAALLT